LFIGFIMLTKVCTKCGVEKTVDCFVKDKRASKGVSNRCKLCDKAYRKDKADVIATRLHRYRQGIKEITCSYNKKYRRENKERIAFLMKRYYELNKSKVNANTSKRRASRILATPSWVDNDAVEGMYYLALLFADIGIKMHVDHIVPLQSNSVCGLHCEANLQLLPASDNISKGNRHWPDMW